jgi:hypothetical protein
MATGIATLDRLCDVLMKKRPTSSSLVSRMVRSSNGAPPGPETVGASPGRFLIRVTPGVRSS